MSADVAADVARGREALAPAATRQLRFTLTLRNPTGLALTDQTVWLYLPMKDTTTQHLANVRVSMPHELSQDSLGHSVLRLSLPTVGPFTSKVVTVQAELALRQEAMRVTLIDPSPWLKAERWIECDDAEVRALAATLQRSTQSETLDAIYDWVSSQLVYAGYVADPLGARLALQKRWGDCTEYAYLCCALARARGIAARPVGGYVVNGSAAPRAEDYHDWTEVYLDGAWRVMDAQKRCWRQPAEDYIAFRVHQPVATNALGLAARFKVDGSLDLRM
ncbi:transglutaminase domain-containing protein [Roseateles sp. SL47]|uniref:transglutaminase-like domain-containing protein n=1 Tax=Roseateles sp. SL47 TaxID=2995138 RepID=UPI002270F985|nr:transglutaminase domain-containing protein [Roseateles sp. SL47]WAC71454.1 transglutaminase domain-containing protein [Roseateles sp. SL47]